MNPNQIRIVAAVIDTQELKLYKTDGTTVTIPQGDPRLRLIFEEAAPQLEATGEAIVTLDHPSAEANPWSSFEQQQEAKKTEAKGLVKFFRIAKEKLTKLFSSTDPVPPTTLGTVPVQTPPMPPVQPPALEPQEKLANEFMNDFIPAPEDVPAPVPTPSPEVVKTMTAFEEIMQHAVPASSEDFHERDLAKQGKIREQDGTTSDQKNEVDTSTDTIIAVVDNQIIPGMEKIKSQIARANTVNSVIGVQNFLKRLASVINDRSHSVEDLLKFLERADLPIADDGSILIYKILNKNNKGTYTDCHTGKVEQWVGAHVCMDISLVDRNRNNECSNGLHVARRGYLGGFSGNVCVLAKLAPEDVIAVPSYDANKMRVCGYHIIKELTDTQFRLLRSNHPLTDDPDGRILLADAIKGKHIGRTHEVRITQQNGGGVQAKPLKTVEPEDFVSAPEPEVIQVPVQKFNDINEEFEHADDQDDETESEAVATEAFALENPEEAPKDSPLDPKEVIKQVAKIGRALQAQHLYDQYLAGTVGALDALLLFKKATKVSWDKLGIPAPKEAAIVNIGGKKVVVEVEVAKPKAKTSPKYDKKAKKKAVKVKSSSPKSKEKEVIIPPQAFKAPPVPPVAMSEGSSRERIAKLLSIGLDHTIAQKVYEIKKASKKSWEALGVSEINVTKITALLGK